MLSVNKTHAHHYTCGTFCLIMSRVMAASGQSVRASGGRAINSCYRHREKRTFIASGAALLMVVQTQLYTRQGNVWGMQGGKQRVSCLENDFGGGDLPKYASKFAMHLRHTSMPGGLSEATIRQFQQKTGVTGLAG